MHLPGHVQRIKASGTIAAGAEVECGAGGTVKTKTTGPKVGITLAAAADGALAMVLD